MDAAQQAEIVKALFEDASDALFLVERASSRLVEGNEVGWRLVGPEHQALRQLRLHDALVHPRPAEMAALHESLRANRRHYAPDGFELCAARGEELIPVELIMRPLGDGPCSLLQLKDLRPQRRLQERADLAESELSLVLSTVPAAVWCVERETETPAPKPGDGLVGWRYRYLSALTESVTGWPISFFHDGPHKFAEIVHPDDRVPVLTERAAFLLSPETFFTMELRLIGKDGVERWVRSDMQAVRDAQGRAVRLDGVLIDIRRSKLAELSLRESQHWLTRLLETNTNGILILDLSGRISFVNPAAQTLLGRRAEDLLDLDWNELPWQTSPDRDSNVPDVIYRTLWSCESALVRPDGATITMSLSAAPMRDDAGRVTGVVITLFDLSQRKRAEEALRRSEERYRRLFERNLAGVCRYTLDGRYVDANPAFAHIFGYAAPEQLRDVPAWTLYFDAEDRAGKVQRLVEQGHLNNIESRRRRRDGSEVWTLESLALVTESTGPIIEATLVDITERKRAEQTLSDEHALLLSLLNSIPDLIFFKDRQGLYRGCNPAFVAYSGLTEADIINRTVRDVFPAQLATALEWEDRQVYETGQPLRVDRVVETKMGERSVEMVLNPMIDSNGRIIGLLGVGRDITERRRLEEQLRQAGKMEAIGRLAGGVAHDFNNLLTIILGSLSLAQTAIPPESGALELLKDGEQAAQRAAELTNHLLGFARRQPLAAQALDLNRCVAETLQLLRRTIDPRVTIDVHCAANLWAVEVDGSQMSQVLMNLCLNARDALPEGGRIRIETANHHVTTEQTVGNLDARSGEFVRLTLSDDGPGIPADVRVRIFEPFFTTKPFGKGTGLGLALVFGIVRQHQGWIECHSAAGHGTRFDIYLPRSTKPSLQSPAPQVLPISGSETILLVDDEPLIRELGRAILGRQGYRVLLAEDGAVGVDVYRRYGDAIDLVLLDLSMPNMSGKEALSELRRLNPNVRVLIASGYSPDQFDPAELDGVLGYISKPYKPPDLIRSIRAALDRSPRSADALPHAGDLSPSSPS
jgi:two-component system, cell cycle sensor histidine kinase and response regulator CckA